MVKIYTKTGDSGTSSIGLKRFSKSHIYFITLGSVDLLNSNIGMLVCLLNKDKSDDTLLFTLSNIQSNLMAMSSYLIGYLPINFTDKIQELENRIDLLEEHNIPLKNFILPGGGKSAVLCHTLRTLCRQAEINIVQLLENKDCIEVLDGKYGHSYNEMNISVLGYINRLSDYFFVLARHLNNNGNNDIIWKI